MKGGDKMNVEDVKKLIATSQYDFLRTNERLGENVILLTFGGSHSYGTNVEGSDVDIRGVTLNSKQDILANHNFEQFTNEETDTVIYSFNKIIKLLTSCNPNVVEMLGCKPEHYFHLRPIGKELIDNRHLFLSKKCIHSFGGYADAQLRRLATKSARSVGHDEQERYILNSIKNAAYDFKHDFFQYDEDAIKLYIDKAVSDDYDTEIFMDINLKRYPLRDYKGMWSVMSNIVKEYSKVGKRNSHAIEHGKLAKHMMHLIRLYLMCIDILQDGDIVTYREKDHDLLMDIRNGKYLDENKQPTKEFMDMVDYYENLMKKAKETTDLPDTPDYKKIDGFVCSVNERIIRGEAV